VRAGKSAGFAWRAALREQADALRALGDPRMAERIADLRDIELQVLGELSGIDHGALALPKHAIVLAEDLLPSQLVSLERERLAGICTCWVVRARTSRSWRRRWASRCWSRRDRACSRSPTARR
jgi:phosphocarrier protein FPr/phosphocarrier protein